MITCIFGKRGSGKTTVARELSQDHSRVLVCDPMLEYDVPGAEKFESIPALAERLLKTMKDEKFYYQYYPKNLKDADQLLRIAEVIKDCCVVLEEVDMICSANYVPPHLSDSIRRGRHWNVDLIAVSRRPAEVPRLLTSQAQQMYLFRFTEPRDLAYFKEMFGEVETARIMELGEHSYIVKQL